MKVTKLSKDEQINKVLENFDFNKVHEYLTFINPKLSAKPGFEGTVPTIEKIKNTAKQLLEHVVFSPDDCYDAHSKGFYAVYQGNILHLSFHIEYATQSHIEIIDDGEPLRPGSSLSDHIY